MSAQLSLEKVRELFPHFKESSLQQSIAEDGRLHRFSEGQIIMDYGSHVSMLPLIVAGSIKVSRQADDGSELFLYYLNPGDTCTMSLNAHRSGSGSAIRALAEEATVVLGLPTSHMDSWLMRFPSWKDFVLHSYDQRLNELINTIDQVTFQHLDQRLIEYLRKRADMKAEKVIHTTHQSIADDLHVSRETISRVLKGLEKQGVLILGRNQISLSKLNAVM